MATTDGVEKNGSYLDKVKELVESTRYGSVALIIQDGKVIQIDKTEKFRI